jgi:hypothetical protein
MFEKNYLRFLALKEISNFRTVDQIREGFAKEFVNELDRHPELHNAFGCEEIHLSENHENQKSEKMPKGEKKVLRNIYKFINEYLLELKLKRKIFIIEALEYDLFYRVSLEPSAVYKFINDCSNFILNVEGIKEINEEDAKTFLYTLMSFIESIFSPSTILDIVKKNTHVIENHWNILFNLFILFCSLKGKIHVVTEHFYLNKIKREGIDQICRKLNVSQGVVNKLMNLMLNHTRDKNELVFNLDIDEALLNSLLAELEVNRINF